MLKKIGYSILVGAASSPLLALADSTTLNTPNEANLLRVVTTIQKIFNAIVPIVIAIALVWFIYGLAEYILESGETGKKEEGRNKMIYGTIALFVIVSVWGLVTFLQNAIGIQGGNLQGTQLPTVPQQNPATAF